MPAEVFTHLLLMQVHGHLLKCKKPEQYGFASGNSTNDLILEFRVLMKHRCEFLQKMFARYIDLKKCTGRHSGIF